MLTVPTIQTLITQQKQKIYKVDINKKIITLQICFHSYLLIIGIHLV